MRPEGAARKVGHLPGGSFPGKMEGLMTIYFNLVTLMTVLLLISFMGLVLNNHNLEHRKSVSFFLSGLILLIAAVSAWVGVTIDGIHPELRWLHMIMTPTEFTSGCAAGVIIGITVRSRVTPWTKVAIAGAVLHGILEVISAFTGFIYSIDEANLYHKGPYYWVYIAFYMLAIVFLFSQTILQRMAYQNQNLAGLLLVLLFLLSSIATLLLVPGVHLIWLAISITLVLYYCYFIDMDLRIDGLTGLLNRKDYNTAVGRIKVPFTIVLFDVNDFKAINDNYGHAYGDYCLKTVASTMLEAFRDIGLCFRIGGDEFCVLVRKSAAEAELGTERLVEMLKSLQAEDPHLPLVAYGIQEVTDQAGCEEGFREADRKMYENKQRAKAGR